MSHPDDSDSRYDPDFSGGVDDQKYNKLAVRQNKLEIELEHAYLTISNLRGELGKWKKNSDGVNEFFFFSEVAKLLSKYVGVVFIPDVYRDKFMLRDRQNGPWNTVLNTEGSMTTLQKNDLLLAKRIVDGASFSQSVAESPFLKTYNILKGALSSLTIDDVQGSFYKYNFSHAHGKQLGIFLPKAISGRRDIESVYEKSYGTAVISEREKDHFTMHINQTAYAQSLHFATYIIKWQDFTLIEGALATSIEEQHKEKQRAIEEISTFRRDSAFVRKKQDEADKEEKKQKELEEKVVVKKSIRHSNTQTIKVEYKDAESETKLTMDDVSELQSQLKKARADLIALEKELKASNLKNSKNIAEEGVLKKERLAYDNNTKILNDVIDRLKKKDVDSSLSIMHLERLSEKRMEELTKANEDLAKAKAECENFPLLIDNAVYDVVQEKEELSKKLKQSEKEATDEIMKLIGEISALEKRYDELYNLKKAEKTEDEKMTEFFLNLNENQKLREGSDAALKLLGIYSRQVTQILDLFKTQGSTHESIKFLEEIITRVCELDIKRQVETKTKSVQKLEDDLTLCQNELTETKRRLSEYEASRIHKPLVEELKDLFDTHLNNQVKSFHSSILNMKMDLDGLQHSWATIKKKKKTIKESQKNEHPDISKNEKSIPQKPTLKQTIHRSASVPKNREDEFLWVHLDQSEITFDDWYKRCDVKKFLSNEECRPHDDRMCQGEWWMQKNVNQRVKMREFLKKK